MECSKCSRKAEYVVTGLKGKKTYLCEKHYKDLRKIWGTVKMSHRA